MRNPTIAVFAPVLAVLCFVAAARGQVAYSNFGPGDTWSTTNSYRFAAFSQGVRFVPANTTTISRVEAGMTLSGPPGITTVTIVTEAGGIPSNVAVWQATNNTAVGRAVYAFNGPSATLTGGQAYWILASTTLGFPGEWGATLPAVAGTGGNTGSGMWATFAFTAIATFRVLGDSAPCCNTKTGGCTVVSSAACTALGLRPAARDAACSPLTCRACPSDFDGNGAVNIQDIFAFLTSWFAGCP